MDPASIKELLALVGQIGSPAVAVLLSMKYAINGMRSDVKEIKKDVKEIKDKQEQHTVEIAVLKATKLSKSIDNPPF